MSALSTYLYPALNPIQSAQYTQSILDEAEETETDLNNIDATILAMTNNIVAQNAGIQSGISEVSDFDAYLANIGNVSVLAITENNKTNPFLYLFNTIGSTLPLGVYLLSLELTFTANPSGTSGSVSPITYGICYNQSIFDNDTNPVSFVKYSYNEFSNPLLLNGCVSINYNQSIVDSGGLQVYVLPTIDGPATSYSIGGSINCVRIS